MTIVLDGMGSDTHPDPEIEAAVQAAELFGEEIVITGNRELLEAKLKAANPKNLPVRIEHAPDVLEMGEKAVQSSQQKPLNSMAVGIELLKSGQAQAFVTAGNTGAAFFNAVKILKRVEGISRPAMAVMLPTRKGKGILIDNGANADCRPEFLLEFAVMGSVYAEKALGVKKPRVGLLANGEEAGKGNQLVKDAYPLLQKSGLNFVGNVEPKEFFAGGADVLVTDGYTGNITLKTSEAVGKLILDTLRESISASFIAKMGYLLIKPAFTPLKKMMDPAEVGAAPLLGVNGNVFIGHGRSDTRALVSAIRNAHQAVQTDVLTSLRTAIKERNAGLA